MTSLVDRLRAAIKERLALAEPTTDGPWVNAGQAGEDDAWQIHGAPTGETEPNWENFDGPEIPVLSRVATLNYGDGGGVWRKEDADHIVANQPSTVTRRCAADLAELGRHTPRRDSKDCPVCVAGAGVMDAGDEEYSYAVLVYEAPPCGFVRYLAGAYGITEEET